MKIIPEPELPLMRGKEDRGLRNLHPAADRHPANAARTQREYMLQLQRTIGNRAVQRLVQYQLEASQLGDAHEQEAEATPRLLMPMPNRDTQRGAEEQIITSEERRKDHIPRRKFPAENITLAQGQMGSDEDKNDDEAQLDRSASPASDYETSNGVFPHADEAFSMASKFAGHPLLSNLRRQIAHAPGVDLRAVRVNTATPSVEANSALSARAYTTGDDIHFNENEYDPGRPRGQHSPAHEVTHTRQPRAERVQRYESGEHAKLGETQAELQAAFAPSSYVVKKGDHLDAIAKKFDLTSAELKDANKDKVKTWPAKNGSGRMVTGFSEGETISIPRKLNDLAKAAIKDKSAKFTINGVVLDYGVGIAMGDLYESPEQMAHASPAELIELSTLVKREQAGQNVSQAEWQKATGGRYLKLAEKNATHFAPPNAGFATPSAAGAVSPNHKTEWEKHHAAALDASRSGDKDAALATNAFADHFLTDAFAAGHLINKRDVMEEFKGQVRLDAKGDEFIPASKAFFDDIAKSAFTGNVEAEFSKYETYDSYMAGWHPNINSVSRFSTLLQGIHKEEPDLLASSVTKGIHDKLNTLPGGLPVENARGDKWQLSGDGTLNSDTTKIAHEAVAQSQVNVISVYNLSGPLDLPELFKKVWSYTPQPTAAGSAQVSEAVKTGTNIASPDLRGAVVKLIRGNYKLIIDELVTRKKLRLA